jgi:DNA-binding response OmpR family regulator
MADSILLVDDEVEGRAELAHVLRNGGYKVTEATDGLEAAACVDKERFSLIITDFILARLHDLINRVRSKCPATPIIVISDPTHIAGTVRLEGIADFLPKPVDPDVLLSRIRHFLSFTDSPLPLRL